ncbi:hypothetical protein GCM10009839_45250 [Catenulispora yoronensis]|uniref:Uncharacterized protein n=1 Tax=Catenulispora yoronensis TaxID=450799 RepID=A0ABP5G1L4_9ACTN
MCDNTRLAGMAQGVAMRREKAHLPKGARCRVGPPGGVTALQPVSEVNESTAGRLCQGTAGGLLTGGERSSATIGRTSARRDEIVSAMIQTESIGGTVLRSGRDPDLSPPGLG